jgi:hypothetical protein
MDLQDEPHLWLLSDRAGQRYALIEPTFPGMSEV